MKKITDFMVDKRYFILFLFIILTGISVFLSQKVKINQDISRYLPSSSNTRIGMDIMDDEFSSSNSSLNIMLKNLSAKDKKKAYEYLAKMDHVSKVEYDDSSNYNKDNMTLYVLTIDDIADSKVASQVYDKIETHFDEQLVDTSGDVSDYNKDVLPFGIIVLAVGCALIILIIMCESYIEPFLFLATILMAVLLNNGTNIIFNNVSNITSSISAILQMALSMDYSIMLISRYQQEKAHEPNKVKAMKKALNNAFQSISSSSVTTIVGLLALVFMSFTIGRDLGLVLAKGVLLSLVCIFTCLPALIVMCDKLIIKTKKKTPHIRLNSLGSIVYKGRYIIFILFILVFGISYLLKGNLGILYTESGTDEIDKVFNLNNQMAVIYNNKYEELISDYCQKLDNDKIKQVMCYGNTINQPLTYQELTSKLTSFGSNIDMDNSLLRAIYYYYYNRDIDNRLTINELINPLYSDNGIINNLDSNIKEQINKLTNYTNIDNINRRRTTNELANLLEIDENNVKQLLIYYHAPLVTTKLTLNDFINFIYSGILTNEMYASNIDNSMVTNLNRIKPFTNTDIVMQYMQANDMAKLLAMDKEMMTSLYTYYTSLNQIDTKLTINEWVNFVENNILINPTYQALFNDDTKENIALLKQFSDITFINSKLDKNSMANIFNIDTETINSIYLLIFGSQDNGNTMTIKDFIEKVNYLKQDTSYLDNVDIDMTSLQSLLTNEKLKNSEFSATELATLLSLDVRQVYQLYALIDLVNNNTSNWFLTPYEFISYILSNEAITKELGSNLSNIEMIQLVMNSTINNTQYSYEEMANTLNMNMDTMKNIYSLYASMGKAITPKQLVDFILTYKDSEPLKSSLGTSTISELSLLQQIINSTINKQTYSSTELASLVNIDVSNLNLLYSIYDVNYQQEQINISLNQFINFLISDVITNEKFANQFNGESINKLKGLKQIMDSSLSNTQYSSKEMFNVLSKLTNKLDQNTVSLLFIYSGSVNYYQEDWKLTVEQFVKFLYNDILDNPLFIDFINNDMKKNINSSNDTIDETKSLLIGDNYSRMIINTSLSPEGEETFKFIKQISDDLDKDDIYIIGNSPMAYEMSQTFNSELNLITILTMIFIFIVVAITFKSPVIPIALVLLIQCAVYLTMGILSFGDGTVYFISLLIVQSILMGATIDYAILYTSYYIEMRHDKDIKESIINAYNKSINTILTSASILIIVTLIVGHFSSAVAAKICKTISQGTLCSTVLILILLPGILGTCDKIIMKHNK